LETLQAVAKPSFAGTLRPTLRYCMETEVHVYAFAVAASVLLSLFPFLNVILSLCRNVFHWQAAVEAVYLALSDFFPGPVGDFIRYNVMVAALCFCCCWLPTVYLNRSKWP
jgi:uncharacterized BrkB/YihY/UPF0761 family membrane protein